MTVPNTQFAFGRQMLMPMCIRGAIVGINFGVMIGLAAWLGLTDFGHLAVHWGLALVVAPVVGFGGPLVLLRTLSNDKGMTLGAVIAQAVTVPASLCVVLVVISSLFGPAVQWLPIIAVGFCVNFINCLSSLSRAIGNVNGSMVLRDCVPQLVLGAAAVSGGNILYWASAGMIVVAFVYLLWSVRKNAFQNVIRHGGATPVPSLAMWGTSVLGVVVSQVDIILGGVLLSPAQVGLYALLRRVANLVALPVSVATWVTAKDIAAQERIAPIQHASRVGSRIALIPGLALASCALIALPLVPPEGRMVFVVLISGAFAQVFFASAFTVATMRGRPKYAVISRALSLIVYGIFSLGVDGMFSNAIAYTMAIIGGSIWLWWQLYRTLGVDTSAAALRKDRGRIWSPS